MQKAPEEKNLFFLSIQLGFSESSAVVRKQLVGQHVFYTGTVVFSNPKNNTFLTISENLTWDLRGK